MDVAFQAATAQLHSFLATYWLVAIGVVALAYYGRHRFNTPEYALAPQQQEGPQQLPRNAPIAKLRGLAPPIFTTSRMRFKRYAIRYILVLELVFLGITLLPNLIAFAIKLHTQAEVTLPGDVHERALWALFGLTGLLSSFPVFKDIDAWLISTLHKGAVIPDGARLTASTLFDSPFVPDPGVKNQILRTFRTRHIRLVAEQTEVGSLEQKLIDIRCLQDELQDLLKTARYTEFQRRLQADLDEMEELMIRGRERALDYLMRQDQLIPNSVPDIDGDIEDRMADPAFKELATVRKHLLFEVDALFFRLCLFTTILIFATESKPEAMNRILQQLGFKVGITKVPSWDWDAIFRVVAAAFVVLLVSSFAYPIVVGVFGEAIPESFRRYVPTTPMQVVFWAVVGAALHAGALLIALTMKRAFARARVEKPERHPPENLAIAFCTYAAAGFALFLLGLMRGAPSAGPLFWALLPATTGYFVGKYIDKAMEAKPYSLGRAFKQAGTMCGIAAATAFVYLPENLEVSTWPNVVWYFAAYSASACALLGLVIGVLFQRLYSHKDASKPIQLTPELTQPETCKVIGDLIVETLSPEQPATPARAPKVVALHGGGDPLREAESRQVRQPIPDRQGGKGLVLECAGG